MLEPVHRGGGKRAPSAEPSEAKGSLARSLIVSLLAMAILSAATLVFAWKIADYLTDAHRSREYWDVLQDSVTVMDTEKPDGDAGPEPVPDTPAQSGLEDIPEEPAGEAAVPAAIDFDSLHAISADAVAWLLSPDTKINYAVAQAEDNDYYLHRLLDGSSAHGGTLFMDYRCGPDFTDWNTVIYGHHMKNGAMFGGLDGYRGQAYYEEHPVMYLYVPGKRYTLELIAGYTTDVYDAVFTLPATKEQRGGIIDHAGRASSFSSGITPGPEDRLVTLSTCSYEYDGARYVVIGRILEG